MQKYILIFLVISFFGCESKNKGWISPVLMDKIMVIVDKYEKHVDDNSDIMDNPFIYSVEFRKIQDDCFILIGTNLVYEPNLDTCTLYKGNLITFYGIDKSCNTFIESNHPTVCKYISDFKVSDNDIEPYRSAVWVYKVFNDSLAIYDQKAFPIE